MFTVQRKTELYPHTCHILFFSFPDGHYVYSDVNDSKANLVSPELTLPQNQTYCLQFWYFVYGTGTGSASAELHVYVSREQAYSRPEWSRSYVPDGDWLKGQVTFAAGYQ